MTLNAWELADVAADLATTWDQLATVYGENATTGRYTTVLYTDMPCRLQPVALQPSNAGDRAELMARRDFYYPPSYLILETSQFEVDNIRWQPEPGTFVDLRAGASPVLEKRCTVLRQQVTSF